MLSVLLFFISLTHTARLARCSLAQPVGFLAGWAAVLGGADPLRRDAALTLCYSPYMEIV